MTDDQFWRLAIAGVAQGVIVILLIKLKSKWNAEREKTGKTLLERIGYRLGSLWARTYRSAK